eukprot:scaffold4968_cov127-Cylindrotheca_fusiformis.AAC.4
MFPSTCRQMFQTRSMIAIRGIGATSFSTASSATTGNSDSTTNTTNTTNTTTTTKTTTMEDRKRLLAKAALKQVPRHGWTQDAITAAIMQDKQFSISMSGLLTPTELVNWCMDEWNQQLVLQKKERGGMLTPYDAIQWRLQQVIPFLQQPQQQQSQQSQQQSLDNNNNNNDNADTSQKRWQEAMAIGLLSSPMTTRNQLHEFIEIIAPPNSSILYKTGLGVVFVSTELFLLADDSENYQETWDFLRVRLQELNEGNFMSVMGSSSSGTSSGNTTSDGTFPLAATTAIASSLLEGVASVILPTSFTSNKNKSTGTKASDYTTKSTSPNQ